MKITTLTIEGIGGIETLELELNETMNIICGPNGIGKTTILEIIAHLFSAGKTDILKRNVNSKIGKITVNIVNNGSQESKTIQLDTFVPEKPTKISGALHQYSSGIISLKTARIFQYQALKSVNKDTGKEDHILWNDAINGINLSDIKNWFVNRYLYSAHKEALTKEQLNNYELAKACFSFLDSSFTFSKVDASSNEIMVNTPSGEIYYEYLSSGFKSIISILFGIIKEIEFRFTDPRINAKDFQGIILIDEIELHLHPEWQGKIVGVLLKAFPLAQFVTTTHSPHVIQTAEPNQIVALHSLDNVIQQRSLPSSTFGFKGWSIEEVLTDVMGMPDTRTEFYNDTLAEFNYLLDNEKYDEAKVLFQKINEFLHPNNHLRKVLEIQLTGLGND
ncbi:MAG: AAA family ATPase [Candidatus Paceibacterota bacterium]